MKLYRGLKQKDVQLYTPSLQKKASDSWEKLLILRSKGDFRYPSKSDAEIKQLQKIQRFTYQHFTDDPAIAKTYTRKHGGIVLEIDLPLDELKKYFTVEFQNFSKRRKKFEFVYIVRGIDLSRYANRWNIKIR